MAIADRFNAGIYGATIGSSTSGRGYGVWGAAGNTTTGYNYGIFGQLTGTQNGAGVYGTSNASDNGQNVDARYAGYFNGDVKVTGTLYTPVLTTTSASSSVTTAQVALAANSEEEETVAEKLAQLSAVQYNMNVPVTFAPTRTVGDSVSADTIDVPLLTDIEMQALEKNHYGLMASQLQQIYPDLVYENQQGDLCINYIEMIPLLVESIKELKAEITQLKSGSENELMTYGTRSVSDESPAVEDEVLLIPALEQNNPNPFTENTVIGYTLPEEVNNAVLYIYNMNGNQVDELPLPGRGKTSVTISGGKLTAGMYLYSLVADGKVIDTKRMILTK